MIRYSILTALLSTSWLDDRAIRPVHWLSYKIGQESAGKLLADSVDPIDSIVVITLCECCSALVRNSRYRVASDLRKVEFVVHLVVHFADNSDVIATDDVHA